MITNTLILAVTLKCNLNCKYCYVQKKEENMPFSVAKKGIDTFLNHEENKTIIFFGGEPLLNFNLIREIVEYTKNKKINYVLFTNALLLNKKYITYFKKNNFFISFSYDGSISSKRGNNKLLKKIKKNITNLAKVYAPEKLNCLYTYIEGSKIYDDLIEIHNLNLKKISITPTENISKQMIKQLLKDMPRILKLKEKMNLNFKSYPPKKNVTNCDFFSGILVTPRGDLKPCTHFINTREGKFYLGNLIKEDKNSLLNKIHSLRNNLKKKPCVFYDFDGRTNKINRNLIIYYQIMRKIERGYEAQHSSSPNNSTQKFK